MNRPDEPALHIPGPEPERAERVREPVRIGTGPNAGVLWLVVQSERCEPSGVYPKFVAYVRAAFVRWQGAGFRA